MRPPKDVREIAVNPAINAIALTGAGIFFLLLGFVPESPLGGPVRYIALLLLLLGIFIGIATIGFYRLQPWSFPLVSFLISGLKGDRAYFKKKLNSPEVRRAFGLSESDSGQEQNKPR